MGNTGRRERVLYIYLYWFRVGRFSIILQKAAKS